jgi:hypothetical protein
MESVSDYPALQTLISRLAEITPPEAHEAIGTIAVEWWNTHVLELTMESTFASNEHNSENDWKATVRSGLRDMLDLDNIKSTIRVIRRQSDSPGQHELKVSAFFLVPPDGYDQDVRP